MAVACFCIVLHSDESSQFHTLSTTTPDCRKVGSASWSLAFYGTLYVAYYYYYYLLFHPYFSASPNIHAALRAAQSVCVETPQVLKNNW